jgi:hypothetical protein
MHCLGVSKRLGSKTGQQREHDERKPFGQGSFLIIRNLRLRWDAAPPVTHSGRKSCKFTPLILRMLCVLQK